MNVTYQFEFLNKIKQGSVKMKYLYVLQQALVWTITIFWLYQIGISLCSLIKLKEKPLLKKKNHKFMAIIPAHNEEDVIVNLIESLKNQFFDCYFMQACATMKKLFEEWIEWAKWQKVLGYEGARSVYYWALRHDMWPKDKLEQWINYTEQAKKEIEVNKVADPILYEKLLNHVGMEAIAFKYLMIRLYADVLTPERLYELKIM